MDDSAPAGDDRFEDLLAGNVEFQRQFTDGGFDGIARAGVLMLTCMDSRILPLEMVGLRIGDAKILRTPGAHLTDDALIGAIVGVHLLQVRRILLVPHTRCAMASGTDADIAASVRASTGADLSSLKIGATPDQEGRLAADVALLRDHPLITGRAEIGGFLYDVDTGALKQLL
ncbi:beta-class carbonic anhydrase [Microlunatus sp. GCM10028923]|uniref:beta-class carbonic anhydrase n=1 Tax=Microlunatus sp. GCM10028923 TaxID=3273400 RepID=UPI003612EC55